MRFAAGATKNRPLGRLLVPVIGVAATVLGLLARSSAAAIPGSSLRSTPGTPSGAKPETSVAGR